MTILAMALWGCVEAPIAADPCTPRPFHFDGDGDGFGDGQVSTSACEAPPDHVEDTSDCRDDDAQTHPGADDPCDGVDRDCDGVDGAPDGDGDGVTSCGGDCDDDDPDVHPGAPDTCNGIDDDCDGASDAEDPEAGPFACGACPPADTFDPGPLFTWTMNPCLLADDVLSLCLPPYDTPSVGFRLHRLTWDLEGPWRDELLLFLPPGPGDSNQTLADWAAHAGYRVLSLGWYNRLSLPAFYGEAGSIDEILYGIDGTPDLDISPDDALVGRLEAVLADVVTTDPTGGWDRWWTADGGVQWEHVVVVGWSQGSAAAARLAMNHPVAGSVLISGPRWAPWLDEASVTPACGFQTFVHREEVFYTVGQIPDGYAALGLSPTVVDADALAPPYDGSALLSTAKTDYQDPTCNAHAAMAMDHCMSDELITPYLHQYCTAPTRCDDP